MATSKGGSDTWGTKEFGGRSTGLKKTRKGEAVLKFGDGTRVQQGHHWRGIPSEFCGVLTMSKSSTIAYRIVHRICGLNAWMLHEVLVVGRNSIEQFQENGLLSRTKVQSADSHNVRYEAHVHRPSRCPCSRRSSFGLCAPGSLG
jgi:hypothetical protein